MCIVEEPRIAAEVWNEAAALAKNGEEYCKLTREEVMTLVWAEYLYWHAAETSIGVYAIGPLANIIGAVAMNNDAAL